MELDAKNIKAINIRAYQFELDELVKTKLQKQQELQDLQIFIRGFSTEEVGQMSRSASGARGSRNASRDIPSRDEELEQAIQDLEATNRHLKEILDKIEELREKQRKLRGEDQEDAWRWRK